MTQEQLLKLHEDLATAKKVLEEGVSIIDAYKRENDELRATVTRLEGERDALKAENVEQARLLGMSVERECSLRAELDRAQKSPTTNKREEGK